MVKVPLTEFMAGHLKVMTHPVGIVLQSIPWEEWRGTPSTCIYVGYMGKAVKGRVSNALVWNRV